MKSTRAHLVVIISKCGVVVNAADIDDNVALDESVRISGSDDRRVAIFRKLAQYPHPERLWAVGLVVERVSRGKLALALVSARFLPGMTSRAHRVVFHLIGLKRAAVGSNRLGRWRNR